MSRRPVVFRSALSLALLLSAGVVGAATWPANSERLSASTALSVTTASRPTLARLSDGSFYAVWYERTGVRSSTVFGRHRSAGGEWDPGIEMVSTGDSLSRAPCLAPGVDGDVHVAWEDLRSGNEEIFYRHRAGTGEWGGEEAITGDEAPSREPCLASGPGGRVHLIWSDGLTGNFEIYDAWRDPGQPFGAVGRLTNHPAESTSPAAIVGTNGDVHLVWEDAVLDGSAPGDQLNTEIYYLRLDTSGHAAGPPTRVSNGLGISQSPTLAEGPDGAIHVVWSDNRDLAPGSSTYFPFAIWLRRLIPGLGFGHEKRFQFGPSSQLNPSICTTVDGTVNIAWEDYASGNADIAYRQIRPETGWDVSVTPLSATNGATRAPCITSDPEGGLYLVWSDADPGQELSVRYRHGLAQPTVPVSLIEAHLEAAPGGVRIRWQVADGAGEVIGYRIFGAASLDSDSRPLTELLTGRPDLETYLPEDRYAGAPLLRVVAIHRDGRLETLAVLAVPAPAGPAGGRLGPPTPNPVRGAALVPVSLEQAGEVDLLLFDAAGRLAARRGAVRLDAGEHLLSWQPRAAGTSLAGGRYWVRLSIDGRPVAGSRSILVLH